jgi:hypothetical protein
MSSIIHPLQSTTTIKPEEDSDTSQRVIVTFQGFGVSRDYTVMQQIAPKISLMNRMFEARNKILEVDMHQVLGSLPPALTRMIEKIEIILEEVEQPQNQHQTILGLFGRRRLTLEEEIAREEKAEKDKLLCYRQLEETLQQMGVQRQQQLLLARVSSGKELEEKQRKIAAYRALAEERYLQDPAHVEMRKQIDRNMIISYKGSLSRQNEKIIEDYWDYVTTASEGLAKKEGIEARSMELFVNSAFEGDDSTMEKMLNDKPGEDVKLSQLAIRALNQVVCDTNQKLKEEKSQCETAEQNLLIEYLILTSRPMMSAIHNMQLKLKLTVQLAKTKQDVKIFTAVAKQREQRTIESCHQHISEHQEKIRQAMEGLAQLGEDFDQEESSEDLLEKITEQNYSSRAMRIYSLKSDLILHTKLLKCHQQCLEESQALLNNASKLKSSAYSLMKAFGANRETPEEIRACMPLQTSFDQQMMECIALEEESVSLEGGSETFKFSVSADMQLDLTTLEDPVEYFYQKIIEVDQKKLKIFEPQVVALDDVI